MKVSEGRANGGEEGEGVKGFASVNEIHAHSVTNVCATPVTIFPGRIYVAFKDIQRISVEYCRPDKKIRKGAVRLYVRLQWVHAFSAVATHNDLTNQQQHAF